MKGKMKKLLAVMLTLTMVLSMSVVTAFADDTTAAALEGEKTSQLIDRATNTYKVQVKVPGGDGVKLHDEVIVMVDGSWSVDEEWPAMREGILEIAKEVLDETGNTQLTLMAFGISPTVVASHVTTVEELETILNQYQGNLLYGRSGTNCSGAFDGIKNYIESHDETLKDAYVVYVTDGGVNINNKKADWITQAGKISTTYARYAHWEELAGVAIGGKTISEESKAIFGEDLDDMLKNIVIACDDEASKEEIAAAEAALTAIDDAVLENGRTKAQQWVVEVMNTIFAKEGLDVDSKYTIYNVEKATVDYINETNTAVQEAFYYTAFLCSEVMGSKTVNKQCAVDAGKEAAAVADKIYLVQYASDSRADWMKTVASENANVEHISAGSIENLPTVIKESLTELTTTPYNNASVTDYMSKWVNLNPETIKVYEKDTLVAEFDAENSDVENGIYKYKWTGEAHAAADPIVLTKVDVADYEAGGADVVGNESGDIYKVTWNIKDGALVRSDNYRLEYEVTVDTEETGFEYDKELVANGTTTVTYTDENDDENTEDIKVPTVDVPKTELPPDQYLEDDTTDTTEETDTIIEEDGKGDLPEDQYLQDESGDTDATSDASEETADANDTATQTGDDTPMGLLFGIAVAAAAVMAVIRKKAVK